MLSSSSKYPSYRLPPITTWLDSSPVLPFPHSTPASSSSPEPFAVVHTSGSTGPPKPVTFTHASFALQYSSYLHLSSSQQRPDLIYAKFHNVRVLLMAPLTVAAGLFHLLGHNITNSFVVVLPPSYQLLTRELFSSSLSHAAVQASIATPPLLRQMISTAQDLKALSNLTYIAYIGAPVPDSVGDILSPFMHLAPLYGSTECGMVPTLLTAAEDWAYLHIHPGFPCAFRPVCHGLYELVVKRSNPGTAFTTVFHNLPSLEDEGVEEYHIGDLFSRHPDSRKGELWRYRGRKGDLTRTFYGETFLPRQMEGIIEAHAAVAGAVIYDGGENGLALVVELREGYQRDGEARNEIWALVERANDECPVNAKVRRELVTWIGDTDIGKLPRGTKGWPVREKVVELFWGSSRR